MLHSIAMRKAAKKSKPGNPASEDKSSLQARKLPTWVECQPQLLEWYATELGQSILADVMGRLDHILPTVFGYQGLQLGALDTSQSILDKSGIHRPVLMASPACTSPLLEESPSEQDEADENPSTRLRFQPQLSADVLSLPIASDVMKLVIMPHTLDFCADPYQALREADRVLTNDGHLIIIGFSRWSLFGFRRSVLRWQRQVPWNGNFYTRNRVSDWLSVLSYSVEQKQSFFLRPPVRNAKLLRRLQLLEKNQRWLGFFGGIYLLHAKKQTIPLNPAKSIWLPQRGSIKTTSLASVRETGVSKTSEKPD